MLPLLVITVVSLLLAVVMSGVAWRAAADERLRSAARVAMLAEAIHGVPADSGPSVFAATQPSATPSRLGVALTIGAFVVSAGVALGVVLTLEARNARGGATQAEQAPPLELVALAHERDGDRLIVRG